METRKQIAAEKKRCNSHNCTQAILHTYADIAGIVRGFRNFKINLLLKQKIWRGNQD